MICPWRQKLEQCSHQAGTASCHQKLEEARMDSVTETFKFKMDGWSLPSTFIIQMLTNMSLVFFSPLSIPYNTELGSK